MLLDSCAHFFYDTDRGHGGGVAERAKRFAEHILCQFADHWNIFGPAATEWKRSSIFAQPAPSFTAGDAPAAGFVRVKMH